MEIVGRIDNDQILMSMDKLKGVMKGLVGDVNIANMSFAKMTGAMALGTIAADTLVKGFNSMMNLTKDMPQTATALEMMGVQAMNLGFQLDSVTAPVLEGVNSLLAEIGQSESFKNITDRLSDFSEGVKTFLQNEGADLVNFLLDVADKGLIQTIIDRGGIPTEPAESRVDIGQTVEDTMGGQGTIQGGAIWVDPETAQNLKEAAENLLVWSEGRRQPVSVNIKGFPNT